METIHGFNCFKLHFDADGNAITPTEIAGFITASGTATDAIFIAHGFRNDEADASRLYQEFLGNFRTHVDGTLAPALAGRRFVVGEVFWPSKAFSEGPIAEGGAASLDDSNPGREEVRAKLSDLRDTIACAEQKPRIDQAIALLDSVEDDPAKQDEFVAHVLTLLDDAVPATGEGIEEIRAASGATLLDLLDVPLKYSSAAVDDETDGAAMEAAGVAFGEEGEAQGIGSLVGSVFGRIGQFLNVTTWYLMKERAGTVGSVGLAAALRQLKSAHPGTRVHLAGHSLGGRIMASAARELVQAPSVQADTLTLLEAAFSHYGFSPNNGHGQPGYFRPVVDGHVIKGAFISTFSAQDEVVGVAYALASRLAGQNTQDVGGASDQFGGIGRNGTQRTPKTESTKLHTVGQSYAFTPGIILNLDGSGGLIKSHGDVTNPAVTFAFASAVAAS